MPTPPDTYENPKRDNPWDNDAVQWLLTHEDVSAEFDRHNLMECARRQKKRLETDLDRVIRAAQLCERHGVHQVQVFDRSIGKTVWRLRRTDPAAPVYPADQPDQVRMTVTAEHRKAAQLLLALLPNYQSELESSGKTMSTIFTYVDRAERFLRRVASGNSAD
jgi:hypothetical protein